MKYESYIALAKRNNWCSALVVAIECLGYIAILIMSTTVLNKYIALSDNQTVIIMLAAILLGPFIPLFPAIWIGRRLFAKAPCPECGEDLLQRVARGVIINWDARKCPFCECDPFNENIEQKAGA